jgi:hypothetical protein
MAPLSFSRILEALAELGSVAIFIAMVLVWADALPVI